MTSLLPALGWLTAVICLAGALSSSTYAMRRGMRRRGIAWSVTALWACPGVAALTGLGVLPVAKGAVLSVLLAVAAIPAVRASSEEG